MQFPVNEQTDPLVRKALLQFQAGDFSGAEQTITAFNARAATRDPAGVLIAAFVAQRLGNPTQAMAGFERALEMSEDPDQRREIIGNLTELLFSTPQKSEMQLRRLASLLAEAIALSRADEEAVPLRARRCGILMALRDWEALAAEAASLANEPSWQGHACLWSAAAWYFLDDKPAGLPYLERLASQRESLSSEHCRELILYLLRYGEYERAESLLDWADSAGVEGVPLGFLRLLLLSQTRRHSAVLDHFADVGERCAPDAGGQVLLWSAVGKAQDALGHYGDAFASFTRMNAAAAPQFDAFPPDDTVQRYGHLELPSASYRFSGDSGDRAVCFLIGFPRSGTTLLEQILDASEGIATLSETGAFFEIARRLSAEYGDRFPANIPELPAQRCEALRDFYFDFNAPALGRLAPDTLVLDKLPLHILHLPLILKIFPDARFLLALRHPLDVCLSCFQQNFAPNQQMAYFTGLERTFRRYREVLSLYDRFEQAIEFPVLPVRYENVVRELEDTAHRVFSFLDVEPVDDVRRFHERAVGRSIVTPSATQVRQPLYDTSVHRWSHYREQLTPFIPLVEPWIERFGYTTDA